MKFNITHNEMEITGHWRKCHFWYGNLNMEYAEGKDRTAHGLQSHSRAKQDNQLNWGEG